jgi:hypothetical protein
MWMLWHMSMWSILQLSSHLWLSRWWSMHLQWLKSFNWFFSVWYFPIFVYSFLIISSIKFLIIHRFEDFWILITSQIRTFHFSEIISIAFLSISNHLNLWIEIGSVSVFAQNDRCQLIQLLDSESFRNSMQDMLIPKQVKLDRLIENFREKNASQTIFKFRFHWSVMDLVLIIPGVWKTLVHYLVIHWVWHWIGEWKIESIDFGTIWWIDWEWGNRDLIDVMIEKQNDW